jgi:hypothetical protein
LIECEIYTSGHLDTLPYLDSREACHTTSKANKASIRLQITSIGRRGGMFAIDWTRQDKVIIEGALG